MKKTLVLFFILFWGGLALAQTPADTLPTMSETDNKAVRPFITRAKVISFLQGHDNLAVLQIVKIESNPWNLKAGDEILVTFMLAPKNSKKAESGDLIRAETLGRMNKNTVQIDYTIMRYSVISSPIKSSEVPSTGESQK